MNKHQELQKILANADIDRRHTKEIWRVMKEKGFDAAVGTLHALIEQHGVVPKLREKAPHFPIWGQAGIEQGAIEQMRYAMRLPISVAGAVMPDAHQGYGLPIGGVLATDNAIIPYGVGVDIGCQVRLSIFRHVPFDPSALEQYLEAIVNNSRFGSGCNWQDRPADHPVLADSRWSDTPFVKNLKTTAALQLGTSGGGNHFVELGSLDDGSLALVTHSGSRGVGARIADYYTKLATKQHRSLPKEVVHLAWFTLGTELGEEYWNAMQLAGDFADACHEIIHARISAALGLKATNVIHNRHNFAWKETHKGAEVIVHRKGATPAAELQLGYIPGTMADVGHVVLGKGNEQSLNSASHGAGRRMSRGQAKRTITRDEMEQYLTEREVALIGGDLDEAPQAYKRIDEVMPYQIDLVDSLETFRPRIVRMADDGSGDE